ncbi:MAG: hypothetical protein M1832_001853 [Thelocarpon impressellum]|nr:MAG: hypothetical protein M1832_001853 [Thelocarpon impressellum]
MSAFDKESGKMPEASYTETASSGSPRKPSLGQRVKAHFRRWWWAHLISFLLFTLVITIILVYGAYPRIAQDDVNKSTLSVEAMVLTDPTPTSFRLHQEQTLRSGSMFHPLLDAFNASLFLESSLPDIKPFAQVLVPSLTALAVAPVVIDQVVEITDMAIFTEFTKLTLKSETFRLGVRGRPVLHQGKLPAKQVDYNQVIELKGLNGLKGFDLTDFEIKLVPEPDGTNMIGKVLIPNPSVLTIEMGNVTFDNLVEGQKIGEARIDDLKLVPGDNHVEMRSTVNQTLVIGLLAKYEDGKLPVDIVGKSVVYDGKKLEYYEAALASNKQSLKLDVRGAIGALL